MRNAQARTRLSLVLPGDHHGGPIDLDDAFRRYAPLVASLALRMLGSPHETESVVQEVFLKARRWVGRIHDPSALRSWLTTVTVRAARRRLQLRRMHAILFGRHDVLPYTEAADVAATAAQRAIVAEVYRLLDRVSIEERLAWSLRHIDGQSIPEVAHHCGCSLAVAKRRIADAHRVIARNVGDG